MFLQRSSTLLRKAANRIYAAVTISAFGVVSILAGSIYGKTALIGIGTSLAAGGIASLISSFNDYLDDEGLTETTSALIEETKKIGVSIADIHKSTILPPRAPERCVLDQTPREPFEAIVNTLKRHGARIQIDAMGLTLEKFHREQLERLSNQKGVSVRVIVQRPDTEIFKQLAKQEKRDSAQEAAETKEFTQHLLNQSARRQGNPTNQADVQIHWFNGSPSITLIRINNIMFVRPRFLGGDSNARVFYEKYSSPDDGPCWKAYEQYFDEAWENFSTRPTLQECEEHR